MLDPEANYDWVEDANCKGSNPNLFIFDRGASSLPAQQICADCIVKAECIDSAIRDHERGWWGVSERQRRTIRRLGITGTEYLEGLTTGLYITPKRGRPTLSI